MKRRSRSRNFSRIAPFSALIASVSPYLFIGLSMGLVGLSAMGNGGFSNIRSATADAFAPVIGVLSRPVQDAAMFVRDISGLAHMQAENLQLRQENMRLRQWYQTAQFLEAENKSLKGLLNVSLPENLKYVTARVMADSGNSYVKSLLVSSGQNDGVNKAQAVMADDGVIGRIVEAGKKTARVLLVTDVNSRVPVLIEDTMQHAVLAGTNEVEAELVHLPPGTSLKAGSRVVTSGHGGIFPYGLPVGVVVENANGTKKVRLFADLSDTVYVRIINTPDDAHLREAASTR